MKINDNAIKEKNPSTIVEPEKVSTLLVTDTFKRREKNRTSIICAFMIFQTRRLIMRERKEENSEKRIFFNQAKK